MQKPFYIMSSHGKNFEFWNDTDINMWVARETDSNGRKSLTAQSETKEGIVEMIRLGAVPDIE